MIANLIGQFYSKDDGLNFYKLKRLERGMSMTNGKKMSGEERRHFIVTTLKKATDPIPGAQLGHQTKVSRQVIVGDVNLLKATGEPIVATSRGYLYIHPQTKPTKIEKVIVCAHSTDQAEEELNILVDHGLTVKDVKIEHPVYGDLTASIMVSNRNEVKKFIQHIKETNAPLLSELTEGMHLHTVSANDQKQIDNAVNALRKAKILVES